MMKNQKWRKNYEYTSIIFYPLHKNKHSNTKWWWKTESDAAENNPQVPRHVLEVGRSLIRVDCQQFHPAAAARGLVLSLQGRLWVVKGQPAKLQQVRLANNQILDGGRPWKYCETSEGKTIRGCGTPAGKTRFKWNLGWGLSRESTSCGKPAGMSIFNLKWNLGWGLSRESTSCGTPAGEHL